MISISRAVPAPYPPFSVTFLRELTVLNHKTEKLSETIMYNMSIDIKHLSLPEWSQRIKADRSMLYGSGRMILMEGWGEDKEDSF